MSALFLDAEPTETLADFRDRLDLRDVLPIEVTGADVSVVSGEGAIRIKDREIPMTEANLTVLADWIEVPFKLANRLPGDLRDHLMNGLFQRQNKPTVIRASSQNIVSVREAGQRDIDLVEIVDVAARVLSPQALVSDFVAGSKEVRFDVIVPRGAERGIGGDLLVGDVCHTGLRFGQKYAGNLAPWVQPFIYRLICTNGMEVPDTTLKVDARGKDSSTVLSFLEASARNAISRVDNDLAHFYDTRSVEVDNPERTIGRLAQENRLSDRITTRLIETFGAVTPDNGSTVTMFDIINHFTNTANDPVIAPGAARRLQRLGGAIVSEHVARCRTCQAKLN